MQWLVTFTELGTGALLLVGLLSRGAALIVLAQHFGLQLAVLLQRALRLRAAARVGAAADPGARPAGLVWGLDGRLARNRPKVRWPS